MSPSRERSGAYVLQPAGFRAFIPAPLPPPQLVFSRELQLLLSAADRAVGRLDGSIETLPNADPFVAMFVRREAVFSSQIAGARSSLHDLLAADERATAPIADDATACVTALTHAVSRPARSPLPVAIREVHERLCARAAAADRRSGEFRLTQNWIGPTGGTIASATYVPPPPYLVAGALNDLDRFLRSETHLPLLVRIGLAHAQFETIHPFLEGNGRCGRVLITLLLCEADALRKPVLCLSQYFKRHRQEYHDRLQAIRDAGDWEGWLAFFLRGIVEVSDEATAIVRRVLAMREEHRTAVTDRLGRGAASGLRVLESLYERPIVSIARVRALTATTFPAANELASRLAQLGILVEFTGQKRHRRFRYDPYVRLFEQGTFDS